LSENPVDAIVSTGPPHSLHRIASKISKQLQIPWLADFRDPWTNIDFYKDLMLMKFADRKHHKMELDVLKTASSITVISNSMREDFLKIHPAPIEVVTNGYDKDDYECTDDIKLDDKFSIAHVGTIAKSRNPVLFWECLNELVAENDKFAEALEIKIIGKADISVWEAINKAKLREYIVKIDHVPHNEAIMLQRKSQVLLLSINDTPNTKSILTSKFFEYMAAERPILCIGPKGGDAEKIINETACGYFSAFGDKEMLKNQIRTLFIKYRENNLYIESKNIEKYSRKELTRRMAHLLDGITDKIH